MLSSYFTGEFLGTMVLVLLGNGVVANVVLKQSKGEGAGWITIASGWFAAVVLGVFVAQSAGAPNADINPAVTLVKFFLHFYSFPTALGIMFFQVLGGVVGAVLVWLVYFPHWKITEDNGKKLSAFSTQPAIRSYGWNLMAEIIGSTMLVVGLGALAGHATGGHAGIGLAPYVTGNPALGLGPYLVGILIWAIGLSLGGSTGYAINPARDLGPRIAHTILRVGGPSDWAYSWVPVLGPFLGAIAGLLIWKTFF